MNVEEGEMYQRGYADGGEEMRRRYVANEGCKCDPPGSGEEWCVGACWLRLDIERERHRADTILQRNRILVAEIAALRAAGERG